VQACDTVRITRINPSDQRNQLGDPHVKAAGGKNKFMEEKEKGEKKKRGGGKGRSNRDSVAVILTLNLDHHVT